MKNEGTQAGSDEANNNCFAGVIKREGQLFSVVFSA
jgi:hypothetical protein